MLVLVFRNSYTYLCSETGVHYLFIIDPRDNMNNTYRYELKPRDPALGGGWNLKLYVDDEEAGGGVYPLVPDPETNPEKGIEWWNAIEEVSRREWMSAAGDTGRVVDAYRAYLTQLAHDEAESQGEWWISSRGESAE